MERCPCCEVLWFLKCSGYRSTCIICRLMVGVVVRANSFRPEMMPDEIEQFPPNL